MNDIPDEDFKRVLRTEMHFLYFQMVETLFEIIFANLKYGYKNIWFNLTHSDWKKNYDQIKELGEDSDLFTRKITVSYDEKKHEIPLLKWIFYFIYSPKISDSEWVTNLDQIKQLLLIFANDFSDRNEYNAYKHALRFYNSSFSSYIGINGMNNMQMICASNDSITYLEEQTTKEVTKKNEAIYRIFIATKPFDFEIDFNRCKIINNLIKNIVDSRKQFLFPELCNKDFKLTIFNGIDIDNDILPNSGLIKQSFSV